MQHTVHHTALEEIIARVGCELSLAIAALAAVAETVETLGKHARHETIAAMLVVQGVSRCTAEQLAPTMLVGGCD